ncbi:hypothetical protein ASG40_17840 [Methylobacterium sp. Leaf399]|nr:hypothetical protein ASF39_13945 [Methylobacterium sp. Leaf108]KQT16557.1 hypothetical protein ASG40_17840 [Methylobacterium sp. Leaf399]KQT86620.1 hypothetical protein ASG59_17175 [Methylobacterium sp. Leaf466]
MAMRLVSIVSGAVATRFKPAGGGRLHAGSARPLVAPSSSIPRADPTAIIHSAGLQDVDIALALRLRLRLG